MRAIAFAFALSLAGCGGAPSSRPAHADVPVALVPSEQLAPPFVVQQKLHGRYGERDISLDVVVQLTHHKLTLVGLTPFGSRAFVLEQEGTATRLQQFVRRELPVRPEYVLADVHRVFFRGLPAPQPDGEHTGFDHGERITERWSGGVLVERRFASEHGEVSVRFEGAPSPRVAPHVQLENQAFGYTLSIDTVSQQLLAE